MALRALGNEPKKGEIDKLIASLGGGMKKRRKGENNTIDFNDFLEIMKAKMVFILL